MIAALFVDRRGPYWGRQDVDAWDIERDARKYAGPYPVVAHPPCERWGRYWSGGPSAKVRRSKGDDNGCFSAALTAVREWGGVIEHPEASHAFRQFGLTIPPKKGGWVRSDVYVRGNAWTCCVEQGHYGHKSRKATWLYLVTDGDPPSLTWGAAEGIRLLMQLYQTSHLLEQATRSAEQSGHAEIAYACREAACNVLTAIGKIVKRRAEEQQAERGGVVQ